MIQLTSKFLPNAHTMFCENDPIGARILSFWNVYGNTYDFVRIWEQRDDANALCALILSAYGDVSILALPGSDLEEIRQFVFAIGYRSITMCIKTGDMLLGIPAQCTAVMQYRGEALAPFTARELGGPCDLPYQKIFETIARCHQTPSSDEDFALWYTDFSHRVRHGCADAAIVEDAGEVASCALALAVTKTDVLLGGVATLESHRHQGLARQCLFALIQKYHDHNIFIFCKEDKIPFYHKLGFRRIGTKAEVNSKDVK